MCRVEVRCYTGNGGRAGEGAGRARAESWGRRRLDHGWMIASGLRTGRGLVLKIIELDAECFTAMEIVKKSSVSFLGFGAVLLREIYKV